LHQSETFLPSSLFFPLGTDSVLFLFSAHLSAVTFTSNTSRVPGFAFHIPLFFPVSREVSHSREAQPHGVLKTGSFFPQVLTYPSPVFSSLGRGLLQHCLSSPYSTRVSVERISFSPMNLSLSTPHSAQISIGSSYPFLRTLPFGGLSPFFSSFLQSPSRVDHKAPLRTDHTNEAGPFSISFPL